MNESEKDFRERLLEREQFSPILKEKYEKEVQAMLEKKLTGIGRWGYIGLSVVGIGFAIFFGTLAAVPPREIPILGRILFVLGAIFGLAFGGFSGWIAKRGRVNLKVHPMVLVGMSWGFICIWAALLYFIASGLPDRVKGIQIIVGFIPFMIMVAVGLILGGMGSMQLKTQEKLLEIEYRLAQIAEAVAKKEQK